MQNIAAFPYESDYILRADFQAVKNKLKGPLESTRPSSLQNRSCLLIILYSVMNSAAQAKCCDFMSQYIKSIREQEYKLAHCRSESNFHFYEWKRCLHKHFFI